MPPIEINIEGNLKNMDLIVGQSANVADHDVEINGITHGKRGLIKHIVLSVDDEPPRLLVYNRTKTNWRTHRAAIVLSDRTLVSTQLINTRNRGPKHK